MLWHARRWACGNNLLLALVMFVGMARMAERNQVRMGIATSLTSHLFVVHL
jgi:hypothetical protein